MASTDSNNERKKVALNKQTYDRLKTFSRFNGVKLRLVIDSMVDVALEDEAMANRIIELALEKESATTE